MQNQQLNEQNTEVSRYQKFKIQRIHRSKIKNAPYNPRCIDKHARRKLKAKLKKVGLLEPLMWNQRSGNLVSGHQRIGILDDLEETNNYYLDTAVVDLDEKTEVETNAFLNNISAQGNFDFGKLSDLINNGFNIENMGFDMPDLQMMFGDNLNLNIIENKEEIPEETESDKSAKSSFDKIEEMKEAKRKFKEKAQDADDAEYYLVIVFQNRQDTDGFLTEMGLPLDDRYIDGRKLLSLLKDDNEEPQAETQE